MEGTAIVGDGVGHVDAQCAIGGNRAARILQAAGIDLHCRTGSGDGIDLPRLIVDGAGRDLDRSPCLDRAVIAEAAIRLSDVQRRPATDAARIVQLMVHRQIHRTAGADRPGFQVLQGLGG